MIRPKLSLAVQAGSHVHVRRATEGQSTTKHPQGAAIPGEAHTADIAAHDQFLTGQVVNDATPALLQPISLPRTGSGSRPRRTHLLRPKGLDELSVSGLQSLSATFPPWRGAILAEAKLRWDALRVAPYDRFSSPRLADCTQILSDLSAYAREQSRFANEDVDAVLRQVAAGRTRRAGLRLSFNRILGAANDLVGARTQGEMQPVVASCVAARHAVPLEAVAQVFEDEGLRSVVAFLYLVLDTCASAPTGSGVTSAPAAMTRLIEGAAWAHGHKASLIDQITSLEPRVFALFNDPFGRLVRIAVGLDHVDALEALVDLPDARVSWGRENLFVALGLAMDAGSVRCARWLTDRGVTMVEQALEDQDVQVIRARAHLAALRPGHGPQEFATWLHERRLEVARICGRL